ncbi:hypothetical protein EDD80_101293 [Anseongella ginsenosidimutans]|uniref:Uncharacterized protein n=1 Tax=Anseongella ginsenosidimutans TaxID=496056 RepID=A0A4R3KWT3_9SPHI|nr:hypothetical protein [Anseongella ginsenosidimutans]QEC51229.1 hypothetical protein FRZ59_01910 [Anseongella ginsenosidimutans]TCS90095.1 hypothetical protein EDD80_101293 [Anseongella ginsenosidimutans]
MKLIKHMLMLTMATGGLVACNDNDDDIYIPPAAFTDHVSISANSWEPFENGGVYGYLTEFEVPDLTENIHDNGAVLVYLDFGEGLFDALPQVYNDVSILYNTFPYSLEIQMVGINNIEIDPPSGEILCKIVLIEGAALKAHPEVDLKKMTLKEVERTFNVQ